MNVIIIMIIIIIIMIIIIINNTLNTFNTTADEYGIFNVRIDHQLCMRAHTKAGQARTGLS